MQECFLSGRHSLPLKGDSNFLLPAHHGGVPAVKHFLCVTHTSSLTYRSHAVSLDHSKKRFCGQITDRSHSRTSPR